MTNERFNDMYMQEPFPHKDCIGEVKDGPLKGQMLRHPSPTYHYAVAEDLSFVALGEDAVTDKVLVTEDKTYEFHFKSQTWWLK